MEHINSLFFILILLYCMGLGDTIGVGPESRFQNAWNQYQDGFVHISLSQYKYLIFEFWSPFGIESGRGCQPYPYLLTNCFENVIGIGNIQQNMAVLSLQKYITL